MKLKRITALFMSALLAMGTLSACGGGNEDSGETGSKEGEESVSTEGVTISIFDKNSGSNTFDDPVAEADADRKELSGYCADGERQRYCKPLY